MKAPGNIFVVGDRVVVEFPGQNWTAPQVIGFESHPRKLGGSGVSGGGDPSVWYSLGQKIVLYNQYQGYALFSVGMRVIRDQYGNYMAEIGDYISTDLYDLLSPFDRVGKYFAYAGAIPSCYRWIWGRNVLQNAWYRRVIEGSGATIREYPDGGWRINLGDYHSIYMF